MAWAPEIAVDRRAREAADREPVPRARAPFAGADRRGLGQHRLARRRRVGRSASRDATSRSGSSSASSPSCRGSRPLVSAPVPVPQFRGEPTDGFPWPYLGARFIVGDELGRVPADEIGLAQALGTFLAGLHGVEPFAQLPVDPNGRRDMARRVADGTGRRSQRSSGSVSGSTSASWKRSSRRPSRSRRRSVWSPPTATSTSATCSSSEDSRLAGVIDWGDACAAAPGIDLLLYWSAFTPADGRPFSMPTGR